MGNTKFEIEELVGAYPTCVHCGSRRIMRDAWAKWNGLDRQWILQTVFDEYACDECGDVSTPVWKIDKEFRKKRIQRLNDEMRIGKFKNGSVVLTVGIQTFGDEWLQVITDTIMRYDNFTKENDPHGEHDFGNIKVAGEKIFWKIDYFDLALKWHSPDAANPDVTHRVLTVMLACEY